MPRSNSRNALGTRLGLLQIVLFGLGMVIAFGGVQISLPPLTGVGVAVAGLGVLVGGLGDVITRRVDFSDSGLERGSRFFEHESYHGRTAVLFGIFWMILGGLAVLGGLAYTLGLGEALLDGLRNHPGIAFLAAGIPMSAYGLVTLIGAQESAPHRSFGRFLLSLPERLVGLLVLALGLAATAAGAVQIVHPRLYEDLWESLSRLLPRLPG